MMQDQKSSALIRFLPSFTDLAFCLPVILLFGRLNGAKTLLGDGDTGWHIRTGEWILANGEVPTHDLFSFTKPDAPWFAWEWLSDVIFSLLYRIGGLGPVVIASILLICLTFALLFQLSVKGGKNRLVALGVIFLAVGGSSVHWLARPHLFTMFFVVLWLSIIDWAEKGRTRLLWLLPLLMVLWTNLHGGFFTGLVISGTFAVGKICESSVSKDQKNRVAAKEQALRYCTVTLACAAASLLNPYTYHLHQHIAAYVFDFTQLAAVNEFQSLSFHAPPAIFFEVILLLSALSAFQHARKLRFSEAILMIGWAHLGLMSARNIPLFLIVSAPFVVTTLDELLVLGRERYANLTDSLPKALTNFCRLDKQMSDLDRKPRLHTGSVATALILCSAISVHAKSPKLRAEYDCTRYPVAALQSLQATIGHRRIFCDDEWGDYLAYRYYPVSRVFIDGRTDFYGASFGQKYDDIVGVKYNWEEQLDYYRIDTLLLSTRGALAGAAKGSARWKTVYDDGIAVMFEAVPPANKISTLSGNEHLQ